MLLNHRGVYKHNLHMLADHIFFSKDEGDSIIVPGLAAAENFIDGVLAGLGGGAPVPPAPPEKSPLAVKLRLL